MPFAVSVVVSILALSSGSAAPADPVSLPKLSAPDPAWPRFGLRTEYWIPFSSGTVHDGESGTSMDLNDDFDIGAGAVIVAAARLDLSEDTRLAIRTLLDLSSWKTGLERDLSFNETPYPAGTPLRAEIHHLQISVAHEWDVWRPFQDTLPSCLSLDAGLAFDRLEFTLDGAERHSEQEFEDEAIPVIGLKWRSEFASWTAISAGADFGIDAVTLFPDSARTRTTAFSVRLDMRPWDSVTLGLGYMAQHLVAGHGRAGFDRTLNHDEFAISQQGLLLSLEVRF